MPDFTTNHKGAVDIRILFEPGDWTDYCSELEDAEPGVPHGSVPPGSWPVVVATALLGSVWVHEWLYLGHLRDYFQSLLTITSKGPSLKEMKNRATPTPQPSVLQQPSVPERPPERPAIRVDLGDD